VSRETLNVRGIRNDNDLATVAVGLVRAIAERTSERSDLALGVLGDALVEIRQLTYSRGSVDVELRNGNERLATHHVDMSECLPGSTLTVNVSGLVREVWKLAEKRSATQLVLPDDFVQTLAGVLQQSAPQVSVEVPVPAVTVNVPEQPLVVNVQNEIEPMDQEIEFKRDPQGRIKKATIKDLPTGDESEIVVK
jgi:hypothetical protein